MFGVRCEYIGVGHGTSKVDSCTVEHTHEIYSVVDSTAEVYPGFEQLEAEAQASCFAGFQEYVGISRLIPNCSIRG